MQAYTQFLTAEKRVMMPTLSVTPLTYIYTLYALALSLSLSLSLSLEQGCQMVYFQPQNPNLGKFWRALELKRLVYSMAIWNILWLLGIFYGHLVI
jgi:hypothetical protein